jgi:hypothetical protein
MEVGEFELRLLELADVHEAGEVDWSFGAKDLPGLELEVGLQAFGYLCIGRIYFKANDVAFAAVVKFFSDGLENAATLFFLHVEVGVAGDAAGSAAENLVAAEHGLDVGFDEVVEEEKVVLAVPFGKGDKTRQGSWDGDDAENLWGVAGLGSTLVAEEQCQAEGLVEDAWEGVGWVDGNGGQERVDLFMEELGGVGAVGREHLLPVDEADVGLGEGGDEALIPAGGLVEGELVHAVAEAIDALLGGEAPFVGNLWEAFAVFELLEDAGDADLDELIEVAGGDGEELDALEEGIGGVGGFFEDAAIELEPGLVAVDETALGGGLRRGLLARGRGLGRFLRSHSSNESKSG